MKKLDEKIFKTLFVENVWTTHVYNQRFKGLSIHSKSTHLNGLQLVFPLLTQIGYVSRL
jgi:hypothetical protein